MRFSELNNKKRREDAATRPVPAASAPPSTEKPALHTFPLSHATDTPPPATEPAEPVYRHPEKFHKRGHTEETLGTKAQSKPYREFDTEARELYSKNIAMAKELLTHIDQPFVEKYDKIIRLAGANAETLEKNPSTLNYIQFSTANDYLYAHSANTTLLSQAMGLAMGLDRSTIEFLGFCAIAHDIGMTEYSDLARRETRLTDAEFSDITLHSQAGADKLDRIVDIDYKIKDRAKKILLQIHERIDASGYPNRLTNEEIDILAQIIGVADVYEAMTHPRPWRPAMHPHNAIKHLIDKEGKGFNSKIVKALMEVLSIYPPGSLVALSTGEIAKVIKSNNGSLTRPGVEILLSGDFEPVTPQILDLTEYPLTSIDRLIEEPELQRRNPGFAAKMELSRWWVEW